MEPNAYLVLANGQVFTGKAFGVSGTVTGEAVFTTGMSGYLETLTDPSFYGQIVVQTFPLQGNYGIIEADFESGRSFVSGYVVREWCDVPSNFRGHGSLNDFLNAQNIVGICGIDTRALTKVLRETGVMNARIISGTSLEARGEIAALASPAKKTALVRKIREYRIVHPVAAVSPAETESEMNRADIFADAARVHALPLDEHGLPLCAEEAFAAGNGKKVVLWDFGAKANIRRELLKRGVAVTVVPAAARAADILALEPDGVMLSNGPGDPSDNQDIIQAIAALCKKKVPLFGICLGHQLLALARGAESLKLKYGHRGENQPVRDTVTGRVYVTSQNHGYAIAAESLPAGAVLRFVNVNDGTCEGIVYTDIPAFSVQFHPEAAAGPRDVNFLFDEFIALMNDPKRFKKLAPIQKRAAQNAVAAVQGAGARARKKASTQKVSAASGHAPVKKTGAPAQKKAVRAVPATKTADAKKAAVKKSRGTKSGSKR
ncbi:MAG: glutamine-hydrolyzing carbamoyl-phosphate synthase small subunit [Treponema sp.]|nr:glutamine-hydrolyzing carbamoyl-phosphate synthase small subunit [Treponema sp.]